MLNENSASPICFRSTVKQMGIDYGVLYFSPRIVNDTALLEQPNGLGSIYEDSFFLLRDYALYLNLVNAAETGGLEIFPCGPAPV